MWVPWRVLVASTACSWTAYASLSVISDVLLALSFVRAITSSISGFPHLLHSFPTLCTTRVFVVTLLTTSFVPRVVVSPLPLRNPRSHLLHLLLSMSPTILASRLSPSLLGIPPIQVNRLRMQGPLPWTDSSITPRSIPLVTITLSLLIPKWTPILPPLLRRRQRRPVPLLGDTICRNCRLLRVVGRLLCLNVCFFSHSASLSFSFLISLFQ